MPKSEPKVVCRTPTPGKQPTHISQRKYDAVRRAILKAVPKTRSGVEFLQLPDLVKKRLSADERKTLGSVPWYTTVVKLDLEVRGEIERIPDVTPQRLRRR